MSVTKNRPELTEPTPGPGLLRQVYGFFSSVKFTILLLALIALGSIFGTVIKQGASPEEYLSLYSENVFHLIRFFGLHDAYHSPWFYLLLCLFALNLIFCTAGRLSRFLKADHGMRLPDERTLSNMEASFVTEGRRHGEIEREIGKSYRCVHKDADGAVFEKGLLSRYAVFIIHGSVILILLGGLVGTLFGFKGYMVLNKGESKNTIITRGENPKEQPLPFSLKCKNFEVAFYPNGQPKDYVSDLEVIDEGNKTVEKEIRVNDPLSYKGIQVYQSSYGRAPLFLFNIAGENVSLRERDTFRKDKLLLMVVRFESMVHDFGPGVLIAYLNEGEPKTVWFLKNVSRLREQTLQGVSVRLEDIKEELYTGLEVSKDPGIWIVWTGFALILFGLYVNFFVYHRRIYVRKESDKVIVAGFSSKSKEAFRAEFGQLKTKVCGQ